MVITEYMPHQTLGPSYMPYNGGVCTLYYTFIENIASFPTINPANQQLTGEPVLKPGATWYGPIDLPDSLTGFTETTARTKGGIYFKTKGVAAIPGSNSDVHINLGNIAYHQLCVVAKLRSGGFWVVYGNDRKGMDVDIEAATGEGAKSVHLNKLSFTYECPNRSPVLPSFQGDNSQPPASGSTTIIIINQPDMERIDFTNQTTVSVEWTIDRRNRFKEMPIIECWLLQNDQSAPNYGSYYLANISITLDAAPPNTGNFFVNVGGPASGFIIIK